jgi:hypothetical protein
MHRGAIKFLAAGVRVGAINTHATVAFINLEGIYCENEVNNILGEGRKVILLR